MAELTHCETPVAGVTVLTLMRAARRNALSIALLEELCDAFDALAADPTQRVVVLRGDGPVFCAGLDLQEAADDERAERSAAGVERALRTLADTPLATIAAVRGGAFAGGAGLMAACDLVVAADDAMFGFPEARRGLLPALVGGVLKTRVREGDLRDLLLTGEAIGVSHAQRIGLVQRVVPAADVDAEALRAARATLAGGPETIRATKRLIAELFGRGALPPRPLANWHLAARRSDESREGLRAFLEKRLPRWHPGEPPP